MKKWLYVCVSCVRSSGMMVLAICKTIGAEAQKRSTAQLLFYTRAYAIISLWHFVLVIFFFCLLFSLAHDFPLHSTPTLCHSASFYLLYSIIILFFLSRPALQSSIHGSTTCERTTRLLVTSVVSHRSGPQNV